jgi:hypothetical protein
LRRKIIGLATFFKWISSERFDRLTNSFSSHFKNHALSVSLHYMHHLPYHKMLRVTPAMAAGVTDRPWSADDKPRWSAADQCLANAAHTNIEQFKFQTASLPMLDIIRGIG